MDLLEDVYKIVNETINCLFFTFSAYFVEENKKNMLKEHISAVIHFNWKMLMQYLQRHIWVSALSSSHQGAIIRVNWWAIQRHSMQGKQTWMIHIVILKQLSINKPKGIMVVTDLQSLFRIRTKHIWVHVDCWWFISNF